MLLTFILDCIVSFFIRLFFFFQAEDGIRDLVRSRGLGDVYKRQDYTYLTNLFSEVTGVTIEQYIINHKIEKIKEFLLLSLIHI